MDPNQATIDYARAMSAGDYDRAEEIAEGLYNWIARGGFLPMLFAGLTQGKALIRCRKMMREASDKGLEIEGYGTGIDCDGRIIS